MSYPIDPDKLLRQARALAGVGAGRGRPSPTNHRRAVSAAYYALFHGLNLEVVRNALPAGALDAELQHASRWVNHRDVRVVCELVSVCAATTTAITGIPKGLSQRAEPLWEALSTTDLAGGRVSAVPTNLRFLVDVFPALQAARHAADYDHLAEFPKATTIGHVEDADEALARLRVGTNDPYFQRFFAWVLARATGLVT